MSGKCDGTQWTTIDRRHYPKGSRVISETDKRGRTVVIIQERNGGKGGEGTDLETGECNQNSCGT